MTEFEQREYAKPMRLSNSYDGPSSDGEIQPNFGTSINISLGRNFNRRFMILNI